MACALGGAMGGTQRIHGRKKRQVLAMFAEERPALKGRSPIIRFFSATSREDLPHRR